MDDASLIKTIAQFKIDVTGATTPLKSLQAELLKVDQQVKKIQSSFGAIGQSFSTMGQSFGATGSKISATAKQTGASIQKVTDATINQLAQIEKQLMSTMSKAGTLGVAIPGAKGQLEIVRQLQDQLMVGQQITEEMAEQIQNASMYATLQSRRIATLEKEIVLNKTANAQQQIANESQQRSALAKEQALKQQRLQQEKMTQAIMRENDLYKQSVFSMEAKVAATMKQLTAHKLTDSHVAQQLTTLRAQIQQYQQLLTSGKILSKIEMDRLRNLQIQLGVLQAQAKTMIADTTAAAKQRAVVPGAGAGGQSVLGSQYERRISWFLAGTAFYGGIRAMKSAISAMSDIESQMVIIERTTQDATFQFNRMRDELMKIGKDFGHGWDVVSDIAVEWTRAGYNVADTLELVRTSLLALNVAEMDIQQATQGLIAIMSQWEFQASDLETVIDKLNITSDRFPVTTGDLIDALLRSSGAARAANIEFDDLIGMVTATRVASGRAGSEIGNAMNTILSYITRQSTLNKLMASGIEVFEDAAQTKLRPAIDIMADVTDKWLGNAEAMPQALVDIAGEMGLFEEELADVIGLQEEWTDLQKVEIEQGMAGVRRRQFLIALMRNFGQVQDVVNNLQDVSGYSMAQNIRTMQILEKQVERLKMELTELASTLSDAGVLGQMKALVSVGGDVMEFFAKLDSGLKTLILTLGEMTILFGVVKSMAGMMGAKTVVAALASPYALPSFFGATAIAAYVLHARQLREEQQQYIQVVSQVAQRQEQLNKVISNSVKGSVSYNAAMDEKRELAKTIAERYPDLIAGYDAENSLIILNSQALQEANEQKEKSLAIDEQGLVIQDKEIQKKLDEIEVTQKRIEQNEQQAQQYNEDANRLRNLSNARKSLIREIEQEGIKAEELARKKQELENVDEAIIRISGRLSDTMKTTSDITVEAINAVIKAYKEQSEAARRAKTDMIKEEIEATQETIKLIQQRIRARQAEFQMEKMIAFRELESASAKLIGMGVIHDPHYYTSTDVSVYQQYAEGLTRIEEETKRLQMDIKTLDELLSFQRKTLLDLENQLANVAAAGSGGGGGGGGGSGGGGGGGGTSGLSSEIKKLSDIINKYIETALRAAEVQGMLNNETQRTIDGMKAKIDYHSRDAATAWERAEAYRTEIEMVSKLREKQEGVHQEANFLREALTKLEARQKTLDITTEDGWESYKKLESQIESIKDSVEKLGIEWFRLAEAQEIGISDFERINSLRDTEIKQAEQSIKYLTREASTKEEVALADEMRIRLIELYNEKLLENQNRMRESEELLIRYRLTVAGIKEGTDEWDNANRVLNRALVEHQSLVQSLTSENYSYMESLEEIRAKTYMQIRLEKEREEEAKRLKEAEEARREAEQEAIRQQEEAARKLQQAFQDAYSHVNDLAKLGIFSMEVLIAKTREAYTILSNVRQLTLSEEMSKVTTLQDSYREYFRGLRDDAIKYADEQIDHYRNIISEVEKNIVSSLDIVSFFAQAGILSTKELIEQTRVAIADLENVSLQDQVRHISTLAGHYRTYFDDILNRAREVHDQQIAMIREQADAKISAIREEIALLDEEAEAESREEAEKQHIQKIEDLQEKRRYHELRTGREHTQAIVDIDKQIEEEMNQWELKQKRWQREDKKVELKKEIDDIEDATKNEIDLLNDKWEDIEKFFKGHTGAMLALAAAYDEDFAKIIESQMAAWIEQIEAGEDATDVWRELTSLTPQAESVVTSLENHITQTSNTAKEAAKDAKNYLEEWEQRLEELREEFSEHNISMLALAAALNPEFFETAKTAGEGWLEGFKEGTNGWEDLIGALVESARNIVDPWLENLPLPGGNGTGSSGGATDWPSDTQWGGYMYYDKDSGLAKVTSSLSEAMSKGKGPIHEYSGPHADGMAVYVGSSGGAGYTSPLALSEYVGGVVATANGEQQTSGSSGSGGSGSSGDSWGSSGNYTGSSGTGTGQYAGGYEVVDYGGYYYVPGIGNVPKSHKGSMVVGEGIASLTPGELVFPPDLSVQLQRLISTLSVRPLPATQLQTQPQQQWRGGGVEIRGNLLNVEKASFEDETDMEILARELNRQIALLRN